MEDRTSNETDVAIIGAGFGGLGAAIRLQQKGFHDFLVFDQAGDVGGTWRDNSYPGCACDVPSHLYSFSFALNPSWSQTYSPQAEIDAYLKRCADDFGVRPHVRLNTTVTDASYDEDEHQWVVETDNGTFCGRVLVAGQGGLAEPKIPE